MEMLGIAVRNILRNPRRTALNLIAITIGVMIILTMKGWVGGFADVAYRTQIDLDTAHVQVLHSSYQEEARRQPLDLRPQSWSAERQVLQDLPGVVGVGARIDFLAQLSNGETALNTTVRGVDPQGEARTNTIPSLVKDGHWLQGDNEIVLGTGLAEKLQIKVGDQVFLTALDQYGVRNLVDATVSGLYTSGYGIFDDAVVYTTLKKAQDTLALGPDDVTRIVLKFASTDNLEERVKQVTAALQAAGLDRTQKAYTWRTFAKTLVDTIESRVRIMVAMLFILILLVVIGVLNSMSMAVQERFQEIGTLRAIGMNRKTLTRMFLLEGAVLGAAGGLIGMTIATVLAFWGVSTGVDVQGFLPRDVPIPLVSVLRPAYVLWDFPLAVLGAALLAVVGSILPARRAGAMVIRDVLGSHV